MGQSITIACDRSWEVGSFREFFERVAAEFGACTAGDSSQIEVREKDIQLPFLIILDEQTNAHDAAEEYAANEFLDETFRSRVVGLRFFSVAFHSLEATRRLLQMFFAEVVRRGEEAWFDTDYGWVISARTFLKELEHNRAFDWRYAKDS